VKKKELKKCLTPLEPEYTVSTTPLTGSLIPYKDISFTKGPKQCFFNQGQTVLGLSEPVLELEANNSLSKFHEYYFINKEEELSPSEQAFLTLERVRGFHDEVTAEDFTAIVSVTGNQEVEVELVPGIYAVSGMVTLQQEVTIPEDRRCFAYTLLTWDKEKCFTLDESRLEKYILGNLQWDTPETYLVVTPEQLYTTQELTLYVPIQDILAIPEKTTTKGQECTGWVCVPYVGCAGESCSSKNIAIPGRVIEDLRVPGELAAITKKPTVRSALEPRFS